MTSKLDELIEEAVKANEYYEKVNEVSQAASAAEREAWVRRSEARDAVTAELKSIMGGLA